MAVVHNNHETLVLGIAPGVLSEKGTARVAMFFARSRIVDYLLAILFAALAQICRFPIQPRYELAFITYVPFIVLAARFCGFGAGLCATILCTFESAVLTLGPRFKLSDWHDWVGVSILLFSGYCASTLFESLQRARRSDALAREKVDDLRAYLAAIVDSSEDAIFSKDLNGAITSWNKSAESIFGYTASEMLGRSTRDLGFPGYAEEEASILAKFRAGESVDHYETIRRRSDGREVSISLSVSPIRNASGQIVGASKIARDITRRKRDEERHMRQGEELLARTKMLDAIVEHSPAAIALLRGPDFVYTMINPAYQAFKPAVPMTGKPVSEIWPEAVPVVLPLLHEVRETGKPFHAIGMQVPRRSTIDAPIEDRFFTFSYVPFSEPHTDQVNILVVAVDVTDAKRAEMKLQESEREHRQQRDFLECLVSNAGVCIAVVQGHELRYTLANPAFQAFAGGRPMVGRTYAEVFPEAAKAGAEERTRQVLNTGETWKVENYHAPVPGKPDAIWEGVIVRLPLTPGDEPSAVTVAWDITERKKSQDAVRESERRHRALIAATSDAVYSMSPDWSEMRRLKGRSFLADTEAIGSEWLQQYIPAEDQPRVMEAIQAAIATKSTFELEHRVLLEDGSLGWTSSRAVPVLGDDNEIIEWFGAASDFTRRWKAEEALREKARALGERENFISGILGSITESFFVLDPEWRYRFASEPYLRRVKIDPAELLGQNIWELFPEIIGTDAHKQLQHAMTDRVAVEYEFYSTRRKTLHSSRACPTSDGGLTVFSVDITERRRAEEALRQSLERMEKVLEIQTVGVMFWDLNTGCMVDANDTFFRLMGYDRKDVLESRLTWQNLTPPEYIDVSRAEIERFLATGRIGPYEKEYFCKDGTRKWLLFAGSSLGNGECVEFCVDISGRKTAEIRRREAEMAFGTLTDAMPQIVWVCTPDGLNTYFSRQWVDYTGLSLEESYGRGWNTPFHPEDKQAAWNAWNNATATGETYRIESRLRAADGSYRWFLMRGVPLRDNGRIVKWFGTCTDIHDLKEAQENLHRFNIELESRVSDRTAQLVAANKELESFAYSVSHDLRAPLRGINGWSCALLEDYGETLDGQAHEYLDRVQSEAKRMGHLIDDLLKLSRVTRAEMCRSSADLTAMANSIASRIREANPERETEFVIEPGLSAEGDPKLIDIALTNLLDNAAKFSSKRAHARVEFGRTQPITGNGQKSQFYVRDNGAGFDMAFSSQLFGAFQRLHTGSEFPGTGIGLATVKRIISRHGGAISAESEPDRGATFYFTLGGSN